MVEPPLARSVVAVPKFVLVAPLETYASAVGAKVKVAPRTWGDGGQGGHHHSCSDQQGRRSEGWAAYGGHPCAIGQLDEASDWVG